jgi:MFS family permease
LTFLNQSLHAALMRLGLLREHDFRQLFFADSISQIGSQITQIALPLIAILLLHAQPFEVGLLTACETAAFLFVGLPSGAIVDRLRRRSVLVTGDLARAVLIGSVPLAWWAGSLTMVQLYLVGLLVSVFRVFFDVAYQSYLPHLVGRDHLVEGNAKLQAVEGVTQIAGPTLAGVLIQWLTAPVAIALDALSFLASAVFVGLIRKQEPKPERAADAHLGREIREGVKFVVGNRLLRSIAMCTGTFNLFGAMGMAMSLVLLARVLHLSAGGIGLFFSVGSIGGLVGALSATVIAKRLGQGPTIWMSTGLTGPFALVLPFAQRGWLLWAAATAGALVVFGSVVYNITQVSFRQGLTPERLLGRMNATMRFLVWGTLPLGGVLGGVLGQYLGVRQTLLIAAIGGMLGVLPVLLSPLRTMRELPQHVADEAGMMAG